MKVAAWKTWMWRAMTIYQFVLIPMSMTTTFWHFAWNMGPFASDWQKYECFATLVVGGPWTFNVAFFACKWIMGASAGFEQGVDAERARREDMQNMPKNLLSMTAMSEEEMQKGKMNTLVISCIGTVLPYLLLIFPIVMTHVIPGTPAFFPVVAFIN